MNPLLALAIALAAPAASAEQSTIVRAMQDEMKRTMSELRLPDMPGPYYASYTIRDHEAVNVAASFGALVTNSTKRLRSLDVRVRVGAPSLDNSNFAGGGFGFFGASRVDLVSVDDDYDSIRHVIWRVTDIAYKNAVGTLEQKKAALKNRTKDPEDPDDFSQEKAAKIIVDKEPPGIANEGYVALVKKLSRAFREYEEIQSSSVRLSAQTTRRYFLSSEGSLSYEPRTIVRLDITAKAQADDGMPVKSFVSLHATSLAGLGSEADLVEQTRKLANQILLVREAPILDDYSGPILFEAMAAPQVMRAMLQDNVVGTPLPLSANPEATRAFMKESELVGKIGRSVMPRGFDVVDDPGLLEYRDQILIGGYKVDGEGMPAERVVIVKNGEVKTLLMSRAPRKEIEHTNGHCRAAAMGAPRARIGNLIVSTRRGQDPKALRRRLLRQAKAAGQDYAIVISLLDEPSITSQGDPSDVFRMFMRGGSGGIGLAPPLVAYKVTADGKEELVRGFRIQPMQVRALKEILAAGKDTNVLSYPASAMGASFPAFLMGQMGSVAEIPTSVVAPSVLFEEIELKKDPGPFKKPPTVTRPPLAK